MTQSVRNEAELLIVLPGDIRFNGDPVLHLKREGVDQVVDDDHILLLPISHNIQILNIDSINFCAVLAI